MHFPYTDRNAYAFQLHRPGFELSAYQLFILGQIT